MKLKEFLTNNRNDLIAAATVIAFVFLIYIIAVVTITYYRLASQEPPSAPQVYAMELSQEALPEIPTTQAPTPPSQNHQPSSPSSQQNVSPGNATPTAGPPPDAQLGGPGPFLIPGGSSSTQQNLSEGSGNPGPTPTSDTNQGPGHQNQTAGPAQPTPFPDGEYSISGVAIRFTTTDENGNIATINANTRGGLLHETPPGGGRRTSGERALEFYQTFLEPNWPHGIILAPDADVTFRDRPLPPNADLSGLSATFAIQITNGEPTITSVQIHGTDLSGVTIRAERGIFERPDDNIIFWNDSHTIIATIAGAETHVTFNIPTYQLELTPSAYYTLPFAIVSGNSIFVLDDPILVE